MATLFKPISQYSRTFSSLRGSIIILEGLIVTGKTTLGTSLVSFLKKNCFDAVWFEEKIPTALLNLYLSDMPRYAFSFQTIIAERRIELYRRAQGEAHLGRISLVDRGLIGDFAFAQMQHEKGFFTEEEFSVYQDLVCGANIEPHATLYLKSDPETCFERLKKRGNKGEIESYDLAYFQDLSNSYEQSLSKCHDSLITIDWNEQLTLVDGHLSEKDCVRVLTKIKEKLNSA